MGEGGGFHPALTVSRSSILQAAISRVLAVSAGSPVFSLPPNPRGSPLYEVSAVTAQGSWGFCGEVRRPCLGSGDRVGSSLVVCRSSSSGEPLFTSPPPPPTRPSVHRARVGAALLYFFVSVRWSVVERCYSINLCELRAISLGLLPFGHHLLIFSIGAFTVTMTALSYISLQGCTFSPTLHHVAQLLLRWMGAIGIMLVLQLLIGPGKLLQVFCAVGTSSLAQNGPCLMRWYSGGRFLLICLPSLSTIIFQCHSSPSLIHGGRVGFLSPTLGRAPGFHFSTICSDLRSSGRASVMQGYSLQPSDSSFDRWSGSRKSRTLRLLLWSLYLWRCSSQTTAGSLSTPEPPTCFTCRLGPFTMLCSTLRSLF